MTVEALNIRKRRPRRRYEENKPSTSRIATTAMNRAILLFCAQLEAAPQGSVPHHLSTT